MNIIRPDLINSFNQFGTRYCDPKFNHFSKRLEYNGHKNDLELNYVLRTNFMIRRLKKDVLGDLPSKIRSRVHIEADQNIIKKIQNKLSKIDNIEQSINNLLFHELENTDQDDKDRDELVRPLMECYVMTGMAKLNGI